MARKHVIKPHPSLSPVALSVVCSKVVILLLHITLYVGVGFGFVWFCILFCTWVCGLREIVKNISMTFFNLFWLTLEAAKLWGSCNLSFHLVKYIIGYKAGKIRGLVSRVK